ncbi:MAG TPA: hypothetical protein VD887_05435 [Allosphingosinicella sp.]|nr:hypothetical protein [Allosphingosinicella sp.]
MLLTRRAVLGGALAAMSVRAAAQRRGEEATAPLLQVEVSLDHDRPGLGRFPLRCEWGAEPRSRRPTVVVVADAQQYFVRPGGAARLQRDLFGDTLNVLAIVGRSRAPELEPLILRDGGPDWEAAYRLLNWRQWARDADAVLRQLDLGEREFGLYGRSGGAHLIHQLLTLRPDLRGRAYVQAAVNHPLDVAWGLGADHLWEQLSASDPAATRDLAAWLERRPTRRRDLVLVLQRQHFFETIEALPAARLTAVRAFLRGDDAAIAGMRERYQIAAIEQSRGTLEGIGAAVRVYEFASPHADPRARAAPLRPDVEALFHYAHPLAEAGYRPPVTVTDWPRLRDQRMAVLQVAGRHDHTADYRTQIGLAGLTRGARLLLLDDDHVFKRWTAAGTQPALIRAFFGEGMESNAFRSALAAVEPLRWRER